MAQARFYDGQTARPRGVSLVFAEEALEIAEGGRVLARWPYDGIRQLDGSSEEVLRLSLADRAALARLEVTDPVTRAETTARCRALAAGRGDGRIAPIVAWSIAAAASLVACVVFLVPLLADHAAPLIPMSWERRLGAAVDNQFRAFLGARTCDEREGRAALQRLVGRLLEGAPQRVEADIRVLNSRFLNAVALPGGRVYLLDGLVERAESVDEIAGVLAHEMGHVARRDGLRKLLQTGATSFLLGLLFGDVAGVGVLIGIGQQALEGANSREAERAADRFAADTMLALGRSPGAMALLLQRIDPEPGPVPSLLRSHPLTQERIDALPDVQDSAGEPLLTAAEWRAVKAICRPE